MPLRAVDDEERDAGDAQRHPAIVVLLGCQGTQDVVSVESDLGREASQYVVAAGVGPR